MAPSIAARRVDGVRRPLVPRAAPGDGAVCPKSPYVLSTAALLPPDEEYGRDGRTRCAAEIRPSSTLVP